MHNKNEISEMMRHRAAQNNGGLAKAIVNKNNQKEKDAKDAEDLRRLSAKYKELETIGLWRELKASVLAPTPIEAASVDTPTLETEKENISDKWANEIKLIAQREKEASLAKVSKLTSGSQKMMFYAELQRNSESTAAGGIRYKVVRDPSPKKTPESNGSSSFGVS